MNRIATQQWSPSDKAFSGPVSKNRPMKTIARFESARRERNTPLPAPVIDQVMVEERAAAFAKRNIKTSTKIAGLELAVSMMDLTTLEGNS
jgi:deoxyribose-phosphate aldolase